MRRYVETSELRCALVVLKSTNKSNASPKYGLRDNFFSPKFEKDFGSIDWPNEFGYKWPFVKDYFFNRKFVTNGIINLETEQGEQDFKYQFFNNTYNGFVLIFPRGEKNKSRVKFVIR